MKHVGRGPGEWPQLLQRIVRKIMHQLAMAMYLRLQSMAQSSKNV
jgi:hypothetical protein